MDVGSFWILQDDECEWVFQVVKDPPKVVPSGRETVSYLRWVAEENQCSNRSDTYELDDLLKINYRLLNHQEIESLVLPLLTPKCPKCETYEIVKRDYLCRECRYGA